ncbi:MAG: 50S ribosomal protein L32e [Sulfolobales archaeon]|nr:50S ribosomal protein L32e [Sulfolobales archaeon]MCX8186395.1 50S ribosomal protein L32e [Sulfolobales archaeon]MDW7968870.1 50S ribosomal protein L32e [Sulfolobales archaeon]
MVSNAKVSRKLLVKAIKKKRDIVFYRNVWWKFAKFRNNPVWRKPKGKDNPMRLKLKGHPPVVNAGFRTPTSIRGMHPSGLVSVVVNNVSDLSKYRPDKVLIYVGGSVGLRKKLEIISKAKEAGFLIANEGVR